MTDTAHRRRLHKRTWDPHGDHLPWLCDCHDCRKRRKVGDPTIATPAERRARDRAEADAMEQVLAAHSDGFRRLAAR